MNLTKSYVSTVIGKRGQWVDLSKGLGRPWCDFNAVYIVMYMNIESIIKFDKKYVQYYLSKQSKPWWDGSNRSRLIWVYSVNS